VLLHRNHVCRPLGLLSQRRPVDVHVHPARSSWKLVEALESSSPFFSLPSW
jgi:hypothetical protein